LKGEEGELAREANQEKELQHYGGTARQRQGGKDRSMGGKWMNGISS